MQKHKLLREIVTRQQQILEDQKQLSQKVGLTLCTLFNKPFNTLCINRSNSGKPCNFSLIPPFVSQTSVDGSPSHLDEHRAHQTVMRRNVVIDKYERARGAEEAKVTKCMTLLNRRRNSVQLKVDQLSRELAPNSGKKRREGHQQFAALEAKLDEMKAKLDKIDVEIRQQQAKKQVSFFGAFSGVEKLKNTGFNSGIFLERDG